MKVWLVTILILNMMMANTVLLAQTDSLIMNTGEFLVGEIKMFDDGVVTIETDYSDSDFKAEWKKVKYIFTEQKFLVLTAQGNRYYGTLHSVKEDSSRVEIERIENTRTMLMMKDILFLKLIEDTFWSRVDFSISAGYSLTKANNNNQLTGNLQTAYTSSNFKVDLTASMLKSKQSGDDYTTENSRTEGGLGIVYFIHKDWFSIVRSDLLQSSEQLLKLRATTKGGVGNYILANNKMNLGFAGGIAWNYEDYDDDAASDRNSAEAFVAVEYTIFDLGDLDFLIDGVAYPGLTEKGRFRSDFSMDLKYEFISDFFVKLGCTVNYDNQPVAGASRTDYVLQTTLGWEL